jgi:hypothetical protein
MISVQNHLPQLSGNKWLIVLGIALLLAACSPKVRPVVAPPKTEPEPVVKPEAKTKAGTGKAINHCHVAALCFGPFKPRIRLYRYQLKTSQHSVGLLPGF